MDKTGYEQIKDIISHIDEYHKEADLREALQEILFICEDNLKKKIRKERKAMFIRKYKLKILEALVGNLRQENQKLKDKVKYRNILIKGADIQMKQLKEENADLRHEKDDAIETLKEIYKLAISNKYNNEKAFNNKIKELAETAIKN